jgi:predicted metal-dependent peptidase
VGADIHRHRGTRAIQRMVEYAPSTGGLALWVQHRDQPDLPGHPAPLATTDGQSVRYGAGFERLPLPLQTGLVAHEVLHIALRHPQRLQALQQRRGDVDLRLFTTCADAIVNSALDHLPWLELPQGSVRLDQRLATALGGSHPVETALLEWDVERLYDAMDDRQSSETSRGRSGEGRRGGAGAGERPHSGRGGGANAQPQAGDGPQPDAEAGASPTRLDGPRAARARQLGASIIEDLQPGVGGPEDPEHQAAESRAWSERIQRAHAGDGAYSMLRSLMADLPRTRTPWEQVLRVQLTRSLSRKRDVSWSRPARSYLANQGRAGPHRRMPFEPGHMPAKAAPRLVIVIDVSGSIADTLLERFAREVASITRRLETPMTLVIGDQRVQRVADFEPGACDLRGLQFTGGGGTDFTPLLEEANRHDPDLTVVLTDLEGPARFRPRAPVLWAVPEAHRDAVAPFGRLLVLA